MYIALQAYVQPTAETDAALLALRTATARPPKLATTVGYGPRFLHSTGQLHKGDAGHGAVHPVHRRRRPGTRHPRRGRERPTRPSALGVLKSGPGAGRPRALEEAGRRVIRFHLGSDAPGALSRLALDV